MKNFNVIIAMLLIPFVLMGQDCEMQLEKAKQKYENGLLGEVPLTLDGCLKYGKFNKERLIDGYKLLTEAYLFHNKAGKADSSFLALLHLSPNYSVDSLSSSYDLIYLANTFRRHSILSFSIRGGLNLSRVHVLQNYGVDNLNAVGQSYDEPVMAYEGAIGLGIPIYKNLELGLEFKGGSRSYLYEDSLIIKPLSDGTYYSFLQFKEEQVWVDVPVFARYNFGKGNFIPYVTIGASANFLFDARIRKIQRETNTNQNVGGDNENIPIISNVTGKFFPEGLRHSYNISAVGGIGFKYRTGLNFLTVQASYSAMLSNIVNTQSRYSNAELLYRYGHVDNDIRLSTISLTVGYIYSIYKPVKKKKYREPVPRAERKRNRKAERKRKKEEALKEKLRKELKEELRKEIEAEAQEKKKTKDRSLAPEEEKEETLKTEVEELLNEVDQMIEAEKEELKEDVKQGIKKDVQEELDKATDKAKEKLNLKKLFKKKKKTKNG